MTKSNGTANAERASKKRGDAHASVANGESASAIENAVTSLIPRVDDLERYFSGSLQGADATEKDAWLSACGGPRAPRSLAADAVLLETCYRLAGDRPEYDFLKAARARVELADGTITAVRQACASDSAMLGPLYEAAASREDRYALGQYFTPSAIADFMSGLVSAFGAESVLDPAIGAGALLSSLPTSTRIEGFDISPICVALASAGLAARGFRNANVSKADFLAGPDLFASHAADKKFDAVICNPPYMRHHLLNKDEKRRLTSHYGARFNVALSSLSTNYVYFFLEALDRLREGGLLVFITPADFLDTRFGEGLKKALATHTTIDEVLLFNRDELAFAGVLTTSAITVARKRPPTARHVVRFHEATLNDNGVVRRKGNERVAKELDATDRWVTYFGEREAHLSELTKNRPKALSDYIRVRRGMATGSNEFFVLSQSVVDEWGIEDKYLLPVVASARDLPDDELTVQAWEALRDRGRPCWVLSVNEPLEALKDTNVRRYLEHGVKQGVHERFNCRTRNPWYKPENVAPPDIIITYMNRGRTRFVRNSAGCRVMSVFLNGFLLDPATDVQSLLEALNAPETSILVEKLGRTYGGGLGKIEPRELAALPIPELARAPGETVEIVSKKQPRSGATARGAKQLEIGGG
jgi:adenine-specific DNA-methyltransferase